MMQWVSAVVLILSCFSGIEGVTWKQCDNPVTVVRDVKIPWNPDSENITVSTDSVAGNREYVDAVFFDKDGNYAGRVYISFYAPIKYWIAFCTEYYKPFPVTLPTATQKAWTITYNYTEKRVVLHCNGVQVAEVVISDSVCTRWNTNSDYRDYWERKPTQINFLSTDTASDSYCISSNTVTRKQCDNPVTVVRDVKIPWNSDSETITIYTNSEAGSEDSVILVFHDKDGGYARSAVIIDFGTHLRYRITSCSDYTPFPVTIPTETEKTWTITYNYTERRLVVHCNGVQVINVVVSDSACTPGVRRKYWDRKFTQMEFLKSDNASDSYCISSNTGAI